MATFTYQHKSESFTVRLERQPDGAYRATVSGASGERTYIFSAQAANDGGWRLGLDGRQMTVYTAAQGDQRYVYAGGQTYTLAVSQSGRRRKAAVGADAAGLTAQMPGQVREVLVSEGDRVQRGQTLVILEAMKMEIRVAAPGDGRVKRLLVHQGDVVERGQRLAEIESIF